MTTASYRVLLGMLVASSLLAGQTDATCPARIHQGQTITVGLPADHRGWILAIRQGVRLFLLSYDGDFAKKYKARMPAPLDSGRFAGMTELKIDTSTEVGVPMDEDGSHVEGAPRKIFTSAGEYEVYLTSAFRQEDAAFSICRMQYEVPALGQPSVFSPVSAGKISCPTGPVHAGDVFTFSGFPANHIGYAFGVVKGGTLFLISYNELAMRKFKIDQPAPLDSREFGKMTAVQLNTKTAVGIPLAMADGHVEGSARKIFNMSGDYQIYMHPFLGHNDFQAIGCTLKYENSKP